MITVRDSSEDEMILCFLKSELDSKRFGAKLTAAAEKLGTDLKIVHEGDIFSEEENSARKKLLGEFRGYPDREIFGEYPQNADWKYVQFSGEDLDNIYYVDYCYWNELSKGTSRPASAAETVRAGIEIYDQPNKNFLDGAAFLETGKFPPIILTADGSGKYTILEGHCRMTSYALRPEKFAGTFGFVGWGTAAR